jgi:two-component system, OmpR family, response regulator MprA
VGPVRILVVDDDPAVRAAVSTALRIEGYEVEQAADAHQALQLMARTNPAALVLDVMMPGTDGLGLCRMLRAAGDRTPILVLTARTQVSDRVTGLDAGADDYLSKPFDLDELTARIRALLRRSQPESPDTLTYGDLTLDVESRTATRGQDVIEFTRTEVSLLELFLLHPGQVLTRELIIDRVWGHDFGPASNSLAVYVSYLRAKLDSGDRPPLIHTVRGVGYRLAQP